MFRTMAMPAVVALNSNVMASRTKVLRNTLLVANTDWAVLATLR